MEWPAYDFNEVVHIDLVGPLPVTTGGHRYLLTMMDRFSKFVVAEPIVDQSAATVALTLLNRWIHLFGVPKCFLSDRGSQFSGEIFDFLAKSLGAKHCLTTAYHPQTNGLLERWHRHLKEGFTTHAAARDLDGYAEPY